MPSPHIQSRVLVVDDERMIADTLSAILRYQDYDAHPAYSAEEAIVWCDRQRPDIVITDVNMGPMNGIELAMHLAQTQPECKVLLISGNAAVLSLMGDEGGSDFRFPILPKPIHPAKLLEFLATFAQLA
jgi:DNA-binding NtrC family response regulator